MTGWSPSKKTNFVKKQSTKNTNATLGNRVEVENDFEYLPSGLLTTASGQIVVVAKLHYEVKKQYHEHKQDGHFGEVKTLENIRSKYFLPRMASEVKNQSLTV